MAQLGRPLRMEILEALRTPSSAAAVARALGQPRQKVNYHVRELERAGLVERVGERRAGNFVESLYRSSTGALVVSPVGSFAIADCDSPAARPRRGEPAGPERWEGVVVSLHVAREATAATETVSEVVAVPGRGLEGDRYFLRAGTFSDRPGDGRDVTLIESEAVLALNREYSLKLAAADTRRNVVTCGVPLNHLVGRTFRVGEAVLRGARLCEPCSHLARLTHAEVLPGLIHRGGLRADVVEGGRIRAGDAIVAGEGG